MDERGIPHPREFVEHDVDEYGRRQPFRRPLTSFPASPPPPLPPPPGRAKDAKSRQGLND